MKQFLEELMLRKTKVKKLMKCYHLLELHQFQVCICLNYLISCLYVTYLYSIVSDVLSSLTTSPNKSELYNSMSTPDSSAKGSLPQTPSTW